MLFPASDHVFGKSAFFDLFSAKNLLGYKFFFLKFSSLLTFLRVYTLLLNLYIFGL